MVTRDIYLRIETIDDYNPVEPTKTVPAGVVYRRDCAQLPGHPHGVIPEAEVAARAVSALVYREYLDPDYLVPKIDKLVEADINEPAYHHRVPGTVIYAHPGEQLKIHVFNGDNEPHSFHVHGLEYGIDSAGAWPFGTQSADGRRSDEICPGQSWTYTYLVTGKTIGVWPFHDHAHHSKAAIDRGLFGAIIALPGKMPKPHTFEPVGELAAYLKKLRRPGARLTPAERREVAQRISWIHERLQLELVKVHDDHKRVLHVPLFFHVMRGEGTPLFDTGDIHENAGTAAITFAEVGAFDYFCRLHPHMTGIIRVVAGAPGGATTVQIVPDPMDPTRGMFDPNDVTIPPGATVTWVNTTDQHHTVTAREGATMPTHCFNGRGFVGNSPTIVGSPGQKIRWYICNLDLGENWHNFHPHAQRWKFANEIIDGRSLGPAESFMVETTVPSPLLMTPKIEKIQNPPHRPRRARLYHLKGDFLFHCHVHHHMENGMMGLIRSRQHVWLTPDMAAEIEAETGLPIDHHDNACPMVDHDRCSRMVTGRIEQVPPGAPDVIQMHAALVPNTDQVLFWGKTRVDQTRLWNFRTGIFSAPATQPAALPGESADTSDLWSAAHAYLNTAEGTLLAHGGFTGVGTSNPIRAYLFNKAPALNVWSAAASTTHPRFYASTITLANGRLLTMFGTGAALSRFIEVYDPSANTWGTPKALPATFDYFYYPWLYLLPDGELFIAGPTEVARKFDWTATPIIDDPAKTWLANANRGSNMKGSSVLLPLRPPDYRVVVFNMGGDSAATQRSVEYIDVSAPAPAFVDAPDLLNGRTECTATLLPDGRILVSGGISGLPGGGPVEVLDPRALGAGWRPGPELAFPRLYHSSAILLPDGSVLIGGDDDGPDPSERYYPSYYDQPRPTILNAPASTTYGAPFRIDTPQANAISEVILMRPGAVTHGFDMSQRVIELVITGGTAARLDVQAPPNGNIAPPGHYLLFIVTSGRIPSEGRWIRLT